MKTSLSLIFSICVILYGATAIAQPPQWPTHFPYPSEFPSSGENVAFAGSGDATGPFVATLTFYTTGGTVVSAFQITNQIVYTFQEFTNSVGVTSRKKLRIPRYDFLQPQNFVEWEQSGFTEFITDQTAPPNSSTGHLGKPLGSFTRSISHIDHDWDYSYDINDNIILFPRLYTDDTNFASRIDSVTANSATMSLTSHRVRSENRRLPFHFD